MTINKEYLGDGVYVEQDILGIKLYTMRILDEHYIVLEPDVFESLIQYAIKIGWLKHGQVLRAR